jgi:hypothetical protein
VPDGIRKQLPDDVVDSSLAGASTEQEIVGRGGVWLILMMSSIV